MTNALRLAGISHQCNSDMTPYRRQGGLQGCRCGVASWDGEEPCKQTPTEVQVQLPRLPPLSRGQPASATKAEGQSKANAVKAAVVKAQSSSRQSSGRQSSSRGGTVPGRPTGGYVFQGSMCGGNGPTSSCGRSEIATT
jgi:hypothetical protein